MASKVTRKSIDFSQSFLNSDVIFHVKGKEFHCVSSILSIASTVFQDVIDKCRKLQISNLDKKLTIKLEDCGYTTVEPVDFRDLIVILHTTGKTPDLLKSRAHITRLLPIMKLFCLQDQIEECEQQLLQQDRDLKDFALSDEFGLKTLRKASLDWAIKEGYRALTTDPDWGLVKEKYRTQIFQAIAESQELKISKLSERFQLMSNKKDMYKSFVLKVDSVINGRVDSSVQMNSTMCANPPEDIDPHIKGSERDCNKCRWYMISRIHNLFEEYRDRRPSDWGI